MSSTVDRALEIALTRDGDVTAADLVSEGVVKTRMTGFQVLAGLERDGLLVRTTKGWRAPWEGVPS